MEFQVLIISFSVSYLGSIPPGTINVTTMQYAVLGHTKSALYFAFAASLTEFVYAGLTVKFQIFLNSTPVFNNYFLLISGVAMLLLGGSNFLTKRSSIRLSDNRLKGRDGFQRGLVLGIANPLTIPFWLAITAYLQVNELISLSGHLFWVYLVGMSTGTFALLLTVRALGSRFKQLAENHFLVHTVPGIIFVLLGLWNLLDLLF